MRDFRLSEMYACRLVSKCLSTEIERVPPSSARQLYISRLALVSPELLFVDPTRPYALFLGPFPPFAIPSPSSQDAGSLKSDPPRRISRTLEKARVIRSRTMGGGVETIVTWLMMVQRTVWVSILEMRAGNVRGGVMSWDEMDAETNQQRAGERFG